MVFLNPGFYIKTLEEGIAFALLALGVYLTFRILDFADLYSRRKLSFRSSRSSKVNRSRLQSFSGNHYSFYCWSHCRNDYRNH